MLGIAGGTGSGKTTVARAIADALRPRVAHIDHDSYYQDQSHLPLEARLEVNYDHPDALDNDLFAHHVEALRRSQPVDKPRYDFKSHRRLDESDRVEPAPVVIVEGILILAVPRLRALLDIKVFVDTADDVRLMRRIQRDIEERGRNFSDIREQYFGTVRPMHLAFVEPSKQHADVIIPEGGENRIAIDVVTGHVRDHLRR